MKRKEPPDIGVMRASLHEGCSVNIEERDRIIAEILGLMARHNLSLADIEEPDNPTEPEVSEN